jgi:hypothetical protein
MRDMTARLASDPGLSEAYEAAHRDYLDRRADAAREQGLEPLAEGTQSAGGMPVRVKCLHALVAHELAVPGSNPFGREALDELPEWWRSGGCVERERNLLATCHPSQGPVMITETATSPGGSVSEPEVRGMVRTPGSWEGRVGQAGREADES